MNCAEQDLLLYAVTDRHWLHGRTLHEVVKESLDGGVTFLQLREKDLDAAGQVEPLERPRGPERHGGRGRPRQAWPG